MDDDKRNDEKQEKPRLKVTDRRKFTADGSPRVPDEEPVDEASAEVEPGVEEAAAAIEEAAAEARPGATATPGSDAAPGAADAAPMSDAGGTAGTAGTAGSEGAAGSAGAAGAAGAAPGAGATAGAAGSAAAGTAPPKPDDVAGAGAGGQPSIADLPRDFSAFVEGMYLEAMLYLGALPDPRTGEPVEDLDMAKYKVDLLGMLQDKTRGNLTDQEGQQLEEVLYQLRMFYVQKTQGKPADSDS